MGQAYARTPIGYSPASVGDCCAPTVECVSQMVGYPTVYSVHCGGKALPRSPSALCSVGALIIALSSAIAPLPRVAAANEVGRGDVLKSGHITLVSGHLVDLENGVTSETYAIDGLDLIFEGLDGGLALRATSTLAALGVGKGAKRDFDGCEATKYTVGVKTLAVGTYVCLRTNKGHLGFLGVTAIDEKAISFDYVLWSRKPKMSSLPMRIGDCVHTSISEKSSRLEGLPDSGSAVSFSNGGYQVDYAVVPAIQKSRVGDPVRMCLVSVKNDCPPGDDRGHIYQTTNLRTRSSWTLPDDEHLCGGA